MGNPTRVFREGNLLVILDDDGGRTLAYPGPGGDWFVKAVVGGPDPGDPEPDGFRQPFPYSCVSSEYGPRSGRVHQGIDFSSNGTGEASPGADILAAFGGTVTRAETGHTNLDGSGFGNVVIINHGVINGRQIYTVYGHMVAPGALVTVGQVVAKGELLGRVGNTGGSYGAHLHWETHLANPGGGISWSNPGTHLNPRNFMAVYGEGV